METNDSGRSPGPSGPGGTGGLPSEVIDGLVSIAGAGGVLTAPEDLIPYSFDGTAALKQRPAVVVFPRTTDAVARCVQLAAARSLPIVTRGSGTGLSGGSVPSEGCMVLCLAKMDAIIGVDPRNLTLRAQAGAITQSIDEAASRHGLFYPPDPGSMRISTIGGNVAENSGGLRGLKYGVTRDYVMGLEVVLADGQVARFGSQCVKDVAGYSMKDLFIGSEGTLGIVTEVLLKLVPRPAARRTMLALYDRIEDAADTVSAIIAARIIPCTLEFLDRMTAGCVEDYAHVGLPTDCEAVLLMETDGHPAAVADEADRMAAIAREHGARDVRSARDEAEALALAGARRNAFSALARRRPTTILEDVTVPRSELAAMVGFIAETAAKFRLQLGTFGHMGDGNLHPTFLTDERDADEMHRVHLALDAIVTKTLALGGTITGEHGVGLAKKAWLRQQMGEGSYALMRQVKQAIDPKGLLNPGKIFD
jgi:glycolate oxidase